MYQQNEIIHTNMKAIFNYIEFLKSNREVVIEKYNKMAENDFFNGITLNAFMSEVVLYAKWYRSEKEAVKKLPFALGSIVVENTKILGEDAKTNVLREKYNGTSAMAMI